MVNKQYSATDLEAFMKIAANWQNSNHNLLEAVDIKSEMQQYMNNPAMNMYKKRERTQNWNHQEKKFLLDLCRKDMRIIENKRLDAGLTAVKNKAWKIIHHKFSSQFGTDRTCNRLKEQWRRMKACTRNEILDYNNRLGRFGQEVADRKKPSPFTFEVWEFMQEAKKACKSEALDGIDYSKIPLALEEDYDYQEFKHETDENECDDSSRTPPQDLCDVDIKEETNETFNDTYNNDSTVNGERLSASPSNHMARNGPHDLSERGAMHSPANSSIMDHTNASFLSHSNDISGFQASFNMNNISATLEALNALRTGQFPASAAAAAAVALQSNFAAAQQQQHHHQQQEQSNATHNSANSNHLHINNNNNNNNEDEDDEQDAEPSAKRQRKLSTHELNDTAQQQQPQQHNTSSSTDDGHAPLASIHCNGMNALNTVAVAAAAAQSTSTATTTASAAPPPQSAELRAFMEMQSKEHFMRMKILDVQLQAAKFNRDLVEINKTLALQKLQEYASKRLAS